MHDDVLPMEMLGCTHVERKWLGRLCVIKCYGVPLDDEEIVDDRK